MPEIIGNLKVKYDTVKVSDKFNKREMVLETDLSTPYPQTCIFVLTQDKCTILDSFNEGDELKVQYNLRGKSWQSPTGIKYFNSLEIWRIEKVGNQLSREYEILFELRDCDNVIKILV